MEGFFVGEFRPKANSSKKERLKMENGIVSHKLFSSIDRKVSFLSLTRLSGIVPTKLFSQDQAWIARLSSLEGRDDSL